MTLRFVVTAALVLLATAPAVNAAPPSQGKTAIGYVLTDEKGMTLYTFDKDSMSMGKSACVDACAQNWPPLVASATDKAMGEYSVITRPDGSKQWAYRGKALYRWAKDMKPNDTTGEGFRDVWHVARP
jgi:predicted lipoprotein with Yx(FWY)xxD motif